MEFNSAISCALTSANAAIQATPIKATTVTPAFIAQPFHTSYHPLETPVSLASCTGGMWVNGFAAADYQPTPCSGYPVISDYLSQPSRDTVTHETTVFIPQYCNNVLPAKVSWIPPECNAYDYTASRHECNSLHTQPQPIEQNGMTGKWFQQLTPQTYWYYNTPQIQFSNCTPASLNCVQASKISQDVYAPKVLFDNLHQQKYQDTKTESNCFQNFSNAKLQLNETSISGTVQISKKNQGYYANILFKTQICRDFKTMPNGCPRGRRCQYAHGERELHDPKNHPLYKTEMCRDYAEHKLCQRGENCFHAHNDKELRDKKSQKQAKLLTRKEKENNKSYQKDGSSLEISSISSSLRTTCSSISSDKSKVESAVQTLANFMKMVIANPSALEFMKKELAPVLETTDKLSQLEA